MSESAPPVPVDEPSNGHWLVPRGRRPVPIARILPLLPLTGFYALLASFNDVIGSSVVSVMSLSLLFFLTTSMAVAAPSGDLLEPRRVVSFYYCIIFCLTPLLDLFLDWDWGGNIDDLVASGAMFALGAYVMTMVGYHLPFFRRVPQAIPSRNGTMNASLGAFLGLAIFAIGAIAYPVLILRVGGIEGLVYSDQGRSTWTVGFGWLLWTCFFMFPGATLFFCARAARKGARGWWISALPAFLSFAMFLVLQGRMRALNGLILIAFASHYLVRPLRMWRVGLLGAAGLLLAFFIGIARAPSIRQGIFSPALIVSEIAEDFEPFMRGFLVGDLSRLRQLALIFGKVPDVMPHDWGQSLVIFMNPFFRLAGLARFQIHDVNNRLFALAHPGFGFMETGYLPSIVGEMLVNFPWYLALFGFMLYGVGLRAIYFRLIVNRGDFASVALYAILSLFGANMLLQSFGHVIFELAIFTLPLFLARRACRTFGSPVSNRRDGPLVESPFAPRPHGPP